jgi:hypothetical protein
VCPLRRLSCGNAKWRSPHLIAPVITPRHVRPRTREGSSLAEAQVGVACAGGPSRFSQPIQLLATAPSPAPATTADKLDRPAGAQHVLVDGPAALHAEAGHPFGGQVRWPVRGPRTSLRPPLAEAYEVPPGREPNGEPFRPGVAANHQRRSGWAEVAGAVLAPNLDPAWVGWKPPMSSLPSGHTDWSRQVHSVILRATSHTTGTAPSSSATTRRYAGRNVAGRERCARRGPHYRCAYQRVGRHRRCRDNRVRYGDGCLAAVPEIVSGKITVVAVVWWPRAPRRTA